MKANLVLASTALLLCLTPMAQAAGVELILNGGFETQGQNTYAADKWTAAYDVGGGVWQRYTGSPIPPAGSRGMLVDESTGLNGVHILMQSFTIPQDLNYLYISFDMYITSAAPFFASESFSTTGAPNQQARVDLMSTGGSLGFGDLVSNIFKTTNGVQTGAYATFSGEVAVTPGSTYFLRIGTVNNQGNLKVGLDKVSVMADIAPAGGGTGGGTLEEVPEPGSFVLMGLGLGGILLGRARARRRRG